MVLYRWVSAPCPERPGYEKSEYIKAQKGEEVIGRGTTSHSKVCFFKASSLCISQENLALIADEHRLPPTAETVTEHRELFIEAAENIEHYRMEEVTSGIVERHALLKFDVPDIVFEQMKSDGKIQEACTRYAGELVGSIYMYVMDEVQMDSYGNELSQYMSIVGESRIPGRSYQDLLNLRDSSNIVHFDKNNKFLFLTTDDTQPKVYDYGQPDFPRLTIAACQFYHKGAVFYDGEYNGTKERQHERNEYIYFLKKTEAAPIEKAINKIDERIWEINKSKSIGSDEKIEFYQLKAQRDSEEEKLAVIVRSSDSAYHIQDIDPTNGRLRQLRLSKKLNSESIRLLNQINEAASMQIGEDKARESISLIYTEVLKDKVPDDVTKFYELRMSQELYRKAYPDIEISRGMIFADGKAYVKTPDSLSIWKSEVGEFITSEELINRLEKANDIKFLPELEAEPQDINRNRLEEIKKNAEVRDYRDSQELTKLITNKALSLSIPEEFKGLVKPQNVRFSINITPDGSFEFKPELIWGGDVVYAKNIKTTFDNDMTKMYIVKESPGVETERVELPIERLLEICESINRFIDKIESVDRDSSVDIEDRLDVKREMFDSCSLEDVFMFGQVEKTMENSNKKQLEIEGEK